MRKNTLFSSRTVLAGGAYTELVSSETGVDKLITAVFFKNNSGGALVPSLAIAPAGTTATETYDIITLASTADDATIASTTHIVLPEGYDLWAIGAADVTVVVQGAKASAGSLEIV